MGKYIDDYFFTYQGKSYPLKEHIGTGSSKHPEQTVRIAFFYHEEEGKVVIGYLGQHQRTDAT